MSSIDSPSSPTLALHTVPDFGQIVEVIKRGFRVSLKVMLKPYLILAGAVLALSLLGPVSNIIQAVAVDLLSGWMVVVAGAIAILASVVATFLIIAVGGLQVALLYPLKLALVEGPDAVSEQGVLALAREKYALGLLALVLTSLMIALGTLCFFLPGLALMFFFAPLPFILVATETEFGDSFKRSIQLALANALILIVALMGFIALFVAILVITMILQFVIGMVFAVVGAMIGLPNTIMSIVGVISTLIGGLIGLPIGFANFTIWGAIMTAIDAGDQGLTITMQD